MRKFSQINLTDEVQDKIAMLYLGCQLHQIPGATIDEITNKLILSGITGEKLVFASSHVIYDAQKLIDFVYNFIYAQTKELLYEDGMINVEFMKKIGAESNNEKQVFKNLLCKIFDFSFSYEVYADEIYNALVYPISLQMSKGYYMDYIEEDNPRHKAYYLVLKALEEYQTIQNGS